MPGIRGVENERSAKSKGRGGLNNLDETTMLRSSKETLMRWILTTVTIVALALAIAAPVDAAPAKGKPGAGKVMKGKGMKGKGKGKNKGKGMKGKGKNK